VLRRLKYSNEDRELAVRLARVAALGAGETTDVDLRRAFARIGRPAAMPAIALWRARAAAGEGEAYARAADRARAILDRKDPLSTGDLAVTGADLMTELGLAPSKQIGQILAALLDAVLADPAANDRAALLARARALARS
jgi:tRNA nucleotidyltransferase (CCA-adding enzyme)